VTVAAPGNDDPAAPWWPWAAGGVAVLGCLLAGGLVLAARRRAGGSA
jgi:hypothetical protein